MMSCLISLTNSGLESKDWNSLCGFTDESHNFRRWAYEALLASGDYSFLSRFKGLQYIFVAVTHLA